MFARGFFSPFESGVAWLLSVYHRKKKSIEGFDRAMERTVAAIEAQMYTL
jgi:hypothetical protein